MIDNSDPKEWSHPEKLHKDAPCPRCDHGGGHHVTVFCKSQIGRRCLTCKATWPIDVEPVKPEGTGSAESIKTDGELKQIAVDLHAGRIFSDRHCANPDEIRMHFPILMLADEKTAKRWETADIGLIYEYMDKAGPMAVNGRPMFFSCRMLTRGETEKMFGYYEKIENVVDNL